MEQPEGQHPCAGCDELTDEDELTWVEPNEEFYCHECINAGVPEAQMEETRGEWDTDRFEDDH